MRCFDCLASQDLCVLLPRSLREADLKIAKLTRVLMKTLYKNLVANPGSWNSAAGRLRGDRAAYHFHQQLKEHVRAAKFKKKQK